MSKKRKYYFEGHLENLPSQKIYLNINNLEKGRYELQIIHKNKILKKETLENSLDKILDRILSQKMHFPKTALKLVIFC